VGGVPSKFAGMESSPLSFSPPANPSEVDRSRRCFLRAGRSPFKKSGPPFVRHSYYANSECLTAGPILRAAFSASLTRGFLRIANETCSNLHDLPRASRGRKNHARRGTIAPDAEDLPRRSSKAHPT